jgi:hypothetical protein
MFHLGGGDNWRTANTLRTVELCRLSRMVCELQLTSYQNFKIKTSLLKRARNFLKSARNFLKSSIYW